MKSLGLMKTSQILKTYQPLSRPVRMWIDGKCYNIKSSKAIKNKRRKGAAETVSEVSVEHTESYNIFSDDDGKKIASFRLPAYYYRRMTQHFNLKQLETETSTLINFPKWGRGELTIAGSDIEKVTEATVQIHTIASEIRRSVPPSHFIAIPVLSKEIQQNFGIFKNEILSGEPIAGMHESIFQSALKLHMTITVFALLDKTEQAAAIEALKEYKSMILDPFMSESGPLKIKLNGIECMDSNYSAVNVLYANAQMVNDSDNARLKKIADDIAEHFYEKGFRKEHEKGVKLHVTLINTKYRESDKDNKPNQKKRWVKRKPFDARPVMEKYKNYYFGECDFSAIHLSMMGSKGEDGFYKPLSIINCI